MSGLGVDYTLMGGQWDNSKPISFSIAPDGVSWDQGTNNVNSQLNSEFGGTSWQTLVAEALQTWSASSNLNFTETSDGPYDFNVSGQSQGDPRFGDIRIGGYAFPTSTIAQTYGPPPNGSTAGGDVKLNTSYNFGPNGQYDLETVLIHEVGHSLGLGESPQPSSLMYTYYSGVRHDLGSADIEGIQSIYGPRVADLFQSKGEATSTTNAVDLTSTFNSAGQSQVKGLSLASIGDTEYFSVTVPSIQGATLHISAVANGISLLSPKVTVIDAATGATLAVDAHSSQYGNNASVSVPNAQAGHHYLIMVTGATQDVFAVGNYSLQLAYSGGTSLTGPTTPQTPVPMSSGGPTSTSTNPTPSAPVPAPTPPIASPAPSASSNQASQTSVADRYSSNTSFASAAELGSLSGQSIIHTSIRSGLDIRVFTFEPATSGFVFLASANASIVVGDALGRPVTSGRGLVGFQALQAGARYFVIILSPNNSPVADASFAIQVVPIVGLAPTVSTSSSGVTLGQPTTASSTTSVSSNPSKTKKKHRN